MDLLSIIIAVVFAVTVHEFAHAFVADRLGDPTPRTHGRLTLNPLRHFDPLGLFALIFLPIGWGKPVPYNPENLRHPKRGAALIALAGPFTNLLTAFIFFIPLKYLNGTGFQALPLYQLLNIIVDVSLSLCVFNFLPFPPLDGSKMIGIFIPRRLHYAYDRYLQSGTTYLLLFILFDALVLQNLLGFSILSMFIGRLTLWIKAMIYLAT